MAVSFKQNFMSFKADSALTKGQAVKIGSDDNHVAKATANTHKAIGIVQNDVSAAEEVAEVAVIGGGAKALLGENVSAGAYLVAGTSGAVEKPNTAGDHVCAIALEAGSTGDLIQVMVVAFEAYDAE